MGKKLLTFYLFAMIFCSGAANPDAKYESENKYLQIKRQIVNLQKSIISAEYRKVKIEQMFPGNLWELLDCYSDCVWASNVDCRVQMGSHMIKEFAYGTYFRSCLSVGEICNYAGLRHAKTGKPNKEKKRRENGVCCHYDKNGYWFVTFVCNAHKKVWGVPKIAKYKRIYEEKKYLKYKNELNDIKRSIDVRKKTLIILQLQLKKLDCAR